MVPSSNGNIQLDNCCGGSWEDVGNVVVAERSQLGELSVEGLVAKGQESWKERMKEVVVVGLVQAGGARL